MMGCFTIEEKDVVILMPDILQLRFESGATFTEYSLGLGLTGQDPLHTLQGEGYHAWHKYSPGFTRVRRHRSKVKFLALHVCASPLSHHFFLVPGHRALESRLLPCLLLNQMQRVLQVPVASLLDIQVGQCDIGSSRFIDGLCELPPSIHWAEGKPP